MKDIQSINGTRSRVAFGVVAQLSSQLVTVITQLASLPLFLMCWNAELYGQWLVISAIPIYLSVSDIGILNAAANMMSIHRARGEGHELKMVFRATLFVVAIIVPLIALLAGAVLMIFQFGMSLDQTQALFALILASLLSVASNLFDATYRPFGKYPKVIVLLAMARLIEWAGSIVGAFTGGNLRSAAAGYLAGRILAFVLLYAFSRYDVPEVEWNLKGIERRRVAHLVRTGAGFVSFTVGSLLTLQGMVILVGTALGGTAVAIFASSRTLTRLVAQIAVMSGKAMAPEISALHGANRHSHAHKLSRQMVWIAMSITILGALALERFGPGIWRIWSRGRLVFERDIFSILLLAAISTAFWQIQSVRLTATNRHQVLATVFLIVSALSLVAAYLGLPRFGLDAAAIATLLPEVAMVIGSTVLLRRVNARRCQFDTLTGP
jgi:O-antigen/teichoic acid export membrane protein